MRSVFLSSYYSFLFYYFTVYSYLSTVPLNGKAHKFKLKKMIFIDSSEYDRAGFYIIIKILNMFTVQLKYENRSRRYWHQTVTKL